MEDEDNLKNGNNEGIKKKYTLNLNNLPRKEENETHEEWSLKRLLYIENDETSIDPNLLTLSTASICHLNIYDEEEELIINGMYIR